MPLIPRFRRRPDPAAVKREAIRRDVANLKKAMQGIGGGTLPASAGAMGPTMPGSQFQGGWNNLGNASMAMLQRVTANMARQHQVPVAEIERELIEQGLTWGPPFPPGRPLDPFFGWRRAPRTLDYAIGENVQLTPRWNRISFDTLKAIYDAYDVAQICVRHLINDVRSLDYDWEPLPGERDDVTADIDQARAFFEFPDRQQPFRNWLAEWLQDVLRYDAGALYVRRNNLGRPFALEVVTGTSLIPLIDFYGRIAADRQEGANIIPEVWPGGDTPGFLQIIEGLPWVWLTTDDIIYQPWNPLPESQYGLSPLEAVLMTANCFSDDTEVLTDGGWKLFRDVTPADKVASRNPETQRFEWQAPTKHYEADTDQPMYRFYGPSIDALVTAGHRMLVDRRPKGCPSAERWGDGWRIQAEELARVPYSTGVRILHTSVWDAPDLERVDLPDAPGGPNKKAFTSFTGDDFAAFMGMWLAEGSARYEPACYNDVWISQQPESKGFVAFKALLDRLAGGVCAYDGRRFRLNNSALAAYLAQFGHATEKWIPATILNMSARQLCIFWDHYFLGDGCDKGSVPWITTSSKRMADQLQEVAQKIGMHASVRPIKPAKPGRMHDGYVIRENAPRWKVTLSRVKASRYRVERADYAGKVYCVSVPNRVIYVRRNGYPMWCGQTDLRFQQHFLEYFTAGTLPSGFMQAPADLSDPAQVAELQETWDALMIGDQEMLRRIRFVPFGSTFTPVKNSDFDEKFPLYLMRRVAASYGVTPANLGFTETVNRATSDTQVDIQWRVGSMPIIRHVEDVINLFVAQQLGLRARLRFDKGQEVEDRLMTMQAHQGYVNMGALALDEVRAELGKPIDRSRPSPRFVMTGAGPVPLIAIESMSGVTDERTYAPDKSQKLIPNPYTGVPGVLPVKGSGEAKAVPQVQTTMQQQMLQGTTGEPVSAAMQAALSPAPAAGAGGITAQSAEAPPGQGAGAFPEPAQAAAKEHMPTLDDEKVSWVASDGSRMTGYVRMVQENGDVALSREPGGVVIWLVPFQQLDPEDGPFVEVPPNVREVARKRRGAWLVKQMEHAPRREPRRWEFAFGGDAPGPPDLSVKAEGGGSGISGAGNVQGVFTSNSGIQGDPLVSGGDVDPDDEDEDEGTSELWKPNAEWGAEKSLDALADLRRWRENARSRVRKGQQPRLFRSEAIPLDVQALVWSRLQDASSRQEVNAIFADVVAGRPFRGRSTIPSP